MVNPFGIIWKNLHNDPLPLYLNIARMILKILCKFSIAMLNIDFDCCWDCQ